MIAKLLKRFGYHKRSAFVSQLHQPYQAAMNSRLTSDWLTTQLPQDEILRWSLQKLRSRSRDLARNSDIVKNYLRKIKTNVVGNVGFTLQSHAYHGDKLLHNANQTIEDAWNSWVNKRNASVNGLLSFRGICELVLESVARDGEAIIRVIRGANNPYKFALQVIDAAYLDELRTTSLDNGNMIIMGVEKDLWGKPTRYHFRIPAGYTTSGDIRSNNIFSLPASEIIHVFVREYPSQTRGVPWLHTAIISLRMLAAYQDASLTAARIGAAKMGFIIPPPDPLHGAVANHSPLGGEITQHGDIVSEVAPGIIEQLPAGYTFSAFDPNAPSGEFAPFTKSVLRSISAGAGVSYNSIASDLEGVNFSSIRSGALEERDNWRVVQEFFKEQFLNDVFGAWLETQLLNGTLSQLRYSDYDKFNQPFWIARSWEWVDPLKDISARIAALNNGLTTYKKILNEQGIDFEEHIAELTKEQQAIKNAGINLIGGVPPNVDEGTEKSKTLADN